MQHIVLRIIDYLNTIPYFWGYVIIAVSSVLQQWFPPYPGDSFALVAGFMAVSLGYSKTGLFLTFWLSTLGSSILLFEAGRAVGNKILNFKIVRKFVPISMEERAKGFVEKYHVWALMICKYVPGINSLVLIIGGVLSFKRVKAYIGIAVGSLVQNLVLFIAGMYVGASMGGILRFLKTYNMIAVSLVAAAILAYVAVKIVSAYSRKKRQRKQEEHS